MCKFKRIFVVIVLEKKIKPYVKIFIIFILVISLKLNQSVYS